MAWTGQNPQQLQPQQQQQQQFQLLQQQQQDGHEDLASHFNLLPLAEAVAEAMERGARDQQLDSLLSEFVLSFDKCQTILNQFPSSLTSTSVQAERERLAANEKLLEDRREMLAKHKSQGEQWLKLGTSSPISKP